MKQIILFSSLFVFSLLVSCGESNRNIEIQEIGLEVMKEDFDEKMNWEDAKTACADLGDGWRLPTIDELEKINQYRDKIGSFERYYWSSTEGVDDFSAWAFDFFNESADYYHVKSSTYYVRAVRDLK